MKTQQLRLIVYTTILCGLIGLANAVPANASANDRYVHDVSSKQINPQDWANWKKAVGDEAYDEWRNSLTPGQQQWWRQSLSAQNFSTWHKSVRPQDAQVISDSLKAPVIDVYGEIKNRDNTDRSCKIHN